MKFLILIFSVFSIWNTACASPECISKEAVAEVQNSIQLPKEFKESDLCNPNSNSYRLLATLLFIKGNKFTSENVPPQFNQNILPESFWDFLVADVKVLVNEGLGGACDGHVAYVLNDFDDSGKKINTNTMTLCPSFYAPDKALIERISVMMHETRHIKGFSHVLCGEGFSKGKKSCDVSFDVKGSYAVSVESLAKMVNSPVFDSFNRAFGKLMLMQYASRAFKTPLPLTQGRSTAIVVSDESGDFIFDGESFTKVNGFENVRLISRYFSLVAVPLDASDVYTADLFSQNPVKMIVQSEPLISYNKLSLSERPEILDLIVEPENQLAVMDDRIEIGRNTLAPTWGVKRVFTAAEMGSDDQSVYFIRDKQGYFFQLNWDPRKDSAPLVSDIWTYDFDPQSIVVFQGQRLALTENGEVLIFTAQQKWEPYAPLQGRKVSRLTRPFLWNVSLFSKN